jgi:hypothetical protein
MIAAEARACTLADGTAVQAMAGTGASTLCTRVMCAAEPCVRSCMALVWQLLHLCGPGPRRGAYLRAVGGKPRPAVARWRRMAERLSGSRMGRRN